MNNKKIRTLIIDDDKEAIFSLKEHLSFIPEVELCGEALQYKKARSLLLNEKPDLVFLDIEMPCKNGFELLNEARRESATPFNVIFHTSYDHYMIQALRESAFDFILKPVQFDEVKNAVQRFSAQRSATPLQPPPVRGYGFPDMISLPIPTGLQFVDKNSIVLFQFNKDDSGDKGYWEAMLNNHSRCRLKKSTTSRDILDFMGNERFLAISPAAIININYIATLEYKSRNCVLVPPFGTINLPISRSQMSLLRDRYDLL